MDETRHSYDVAATVIGLSKTRKLGWVFRKHTTRLLGLKRCHDSLALMTSQLPKIDDVRIDFPLVEYNDYAT